MSREARRRPATAVLAAAAGAGAGAVAGALVGGLPEVLFLGVLAASASVLAWLTGVAWRSARLESVRRRSLDSTRAEDVASAAVGEERARLAADIVARLLHALEDVEIQARHAKQALDDGADPVASLRRIQVLAQGCTAELRRQLGLLRPVAGASAASGEPVIYAADRDTLQVPDRIGAQRLPGARRQPTWTISGWDLALAVPVSVLAAAESIAYPVAAGEPGDPRSVAVAVLVGASVLVRRAAPVAAAVVAAGLCLVALVVGVPLQPGFWMLGSLVPMLWRIGSTEAGRPRTVAAGALLASAPTTTVWIQDPENGPVTGAVLLIPLLAGLFRARSLRIAASNSAVAAERVAILDEAAELARQHERAEFAREMHDVVSHAIGVIAIQAGAGEVSWPSRPQATRAALDAITSSAAAARDEIQRLPADSRHAVEQTDIDALADRIRASGTPVRLSVVGAVPDELKGIVHRVVQESLTNVLRHAHGAAARVEIGREADRLRVEVRDDGAELASARRGFGLSGLAERVALAGGSLHAGPLAHGGFGVLVELPLPHEAAQRAEPGVLR